MTVPSGLRELDRWMTASLAEAEELVPPLLSLPSDRFRHELRERPALRTPGVFKRLLAVARASMERVPSRAREITVVVLRYARIMEVPSSFADTSLMVQGEAWRDYAAALRELGRLDKAGYAVRLARRCFENVPGSTFHLATVDLIEARLLHERGLFGAGLRMVRQAGHHFALSRDHALYLDARVLETWMLCAGGQSEAASALWQTAAEAARASRDHGLAARIYDTLGVLELRNGNAAEASRLFASALALFEPADVSEDPIRARRHLAEAAAAQGRLHEAISEYHMVRTELLKRSSFVGAALAAVEVLDLLLLAGRADQLPALTSTFVEVFQDAGTFMNLLEAFVWLRSRARKASLTHADVLVAQAFFEDLIHRPHARFRRV